MPKRLIVLLSLLAAAAQAQDTPPDDATIAALLIGTWVNPRESPDFTDEPAKETFRADGTYTFYQYADRACTRLATATSARWYVTEGMLVSVLDNGSEIKDVVLSIDRQRLLLRHFLDGQTYLRRKSETCPTATLQSRAAPAGSQLTASRQTSVRTIP